MATTTGAYDILKHSTRSEEEISFVSNARVPTKRSLLLTETRELDLRKERLFFFRLPSSLPLPSDAFLSRSGENENTYGLPFVVCESPTLRRFLLKPEQHISNSSYPNFSANDRLLIKARNYRLHPVDQQIDVVAIIDYLLARSVEPFLVNVYFVNVIFPPFFLF